MLIISANFEIIIRRDQLLKILPYQANISTGGNNIILAFNGYIRTKGSVKNCRLQFKIDKVKSSLSAAILDEKPNKPTA